MQTCMTSLTFGSDVIDLLVKPGARNFTRNLGWRAQKRTSSTNPKIALFFFSIFVRAAGIIFIIALVEFPFRQTLMKHMCTCSTADINVMYIQVDELPQKQKDLWIKINDAFNENSQHPRTAAELTKKWDNLVQTHRANTNCSAVETPSQLSHTIELYEEPLQPVQDISTSYIVNCSGSSSSNNTNNNGCSHCSTCMEIMALKKRKLQLEVQHLEKRLKTDH
ncbi:hypothetical protein MAR_033039 [Mya arenaria]|uniref:Myb/SANT-like DNA-binding domain-containing protein n=1 Tax=Mya arenaria TaxID=6604 RepID=A0ABY7G9C1_MYAAR|nr:hypothetical protein MAR_033039 [Mya arenaria]